MNGNSKLILFDYDGTLVDSESTIINGIKFALEFYGYNKPSDTILRQSIGRALLPVFQEITSIDNPEIHSQLLEKYREWYNLESSKGLIKDTLYSNAKSALIKLYKDNYLLGIATNKSRSGLDEGLNRHKIKKYFVSTKTVHDCIPKPSPDMGLESMSELGVSKVFTIMVGDTVNDALMAKACGIGFIGVDWGFNKPSVLIDNGAISVANSFDNLLSKVEKYFS